MGSAQACHQSGPSTDFRFAEFGELPLPIPDKDEQDRIVAFLDQKTTQIDAAITKKKRQIEALQEKRKIRISRAVTQGLRLGAALKDSGSVAIGTIPICRACSRAACRCRSNT
ncbi:restriction endonuclease subunit S [Burkholderia pseudomallei]|nr:restriction endonuclease subunit S [Burkholderia pseudomallei]MBO7784033.1 restriction endonuclease subunit S [Burkholderia pseudomallei]